MSAFPITTYGLFGIRDSGAPPNSNDYTTLVMIHGYGVNSATFERLLPVAAKNNARVVLVNRRDYPGSAPISEEELTQLRSLPSLADNLALKYLQEYLSARSREVHDFLVDFVKNENVPVSGGIILAGWSFATKLINGFLANAASFSSDGVDLRKYIKRLTIYDGPSIALGYEGPPNSWSPLFDPTLAPEDVPRVFGGWVTAYYDHGDGESPSSLEYRDPLPEPPSTLLGMSPSEMQACFEHGPAQPVLPNGSDERLMSLGVKYGLFAHLRDAALYLTVHGQDKESNTADAARSAAASQWDDLELQYVWCDQSVWYIPWAIMETRARLEEGKKSGKPMRNVTMVRIKGANHFYHWEQPEVALKAILGA